MKEFGTLIWGHDFQSLPSVEEQHLDHPWIHDKYSAVASLASPLQQVLSGNSFKQSYLAVLSSLFYCLCSAIMYIQLRLISVPKESEFSPSPKEKSLIGNQSPMAPLCSEGKQLLDDELHTLSCCCYSYICFKWYWYNTMLKPISIQCKHNFDYFDYLWLLDG